jgi:hypothetical protein
MSRIILLLGILLCSWSGFAQPKADKPAIQSLLSYAQPLKPQRTLAKGTPYFLPGWSKGELITIKGAKVKGLRLKYDTSQDRLLVLCDGDSMILPSDQISYFRIGDRKHYYEFERIYTNESKGHFKKGYYQVLYEGRVKLLAKARKKVKKEYYQDKTRYYLFSENQSIRGIKPQRKHLLNKLRHRKYELERYIEAYDLNPQNTQHLVKIVAYYDSLI